jgi:two-component system sensor histidine kinase QseC
VSRPARSLQWRLIGTVVGLVAALWIAVAAFVWVDVRHELDELHDGHLAQAAALLVAQNLREIEDDEPVDAPLLHRYAPRVAFQVWHEGRLALRSANAPVAPMVSGRGRSPSGFETIQIDGQGWRVFATRGAEHDVQVFVGERTSARAAILRAVLRGMLTPLALALPLLALAGWWAVRRGLLPLRRLGDTLARRRPDALQPVALDDVPAEMAPMLAALNDLLARIAALMETERRFTADAAHELRTPIAAIRTQAQVALGEADHAARRHALEATVEGCDRATRLVEQLLTLSRLEAGGAPARTPVDLAVVARGVVAALAPQAIARRQDLGLDAPQPCQVTGDETLLAVLLRNLVDNALRYSADGAAVQVRVECHGAQARLVVADAGPGVAEAARARLGERFFRVLGSGASGSGLGWSIVARIVAVHHGSVRSGSSAALGGLEVTVDLPLSAESVRAA